MGGDIVARNFFKRDFCFRRGAVLTCFLALGFDWVDPFLDQLAQVFRDVSRI